MLHRSQRPAPLSDDVLRQAILDAIANTGGAKFVFADGLYEKLAVRGVSDQDLLCVCRQWERVTARTWDKLSWRYRIEGENLDGHWMSVVVAVSTTQSTIVAITAFRFSRGRRGKP